MSSSRWFEHWNAISLQESETDLLKQVGKTIDRQPVPMVHIDRIVNTILAALDLCTDDRVLDLCCGNGLLTARIATACDQILGIDFSAPLIGVANTRNRLGNVEYLLRSVLALPEILIERGEATFTKAYMYEAFQHFSQDEAQALLSALGAHMPVNFRLFLGSIPDRTRLYDFYNTPERRLEYEQRVRDGTEAIGTWWLVSEVNEIAKAAGFSCAIFRQHDSLYTAHYRFDALLEIRHAKSLP
jgi:cyclopropane fatty-acyl-phospholipid synthase-like methyltransferase